MDCFFFEITIDGKWSKIITWRKKVSFHIFETPCIKTDSNSRSFLSKRLQGEVGLLLRKKWE